MPVVRFIELETGYVVTERGTACSKPKPRNHERQRAKVPNDGPRVVGSRMKSAGRMRMHLRNKLQPLFAEMTEQFAHTLRRNVKSVTLNDLFGAVDLHDSLVIEGTATQPEGHGFAILDASKAEARQCFIENGGAEIEHLGLHHIAPRAAQLIEQAR